MWCFAVSTGSEARRTKRLPIWLKCYANINNIGRAEGTVPKRATRVPLAGLAVCPVDYPSSSVSFPLPWFVVQIHLRYGRSSSCGTVRTRTALLRSSSAANNPFPDALTSFGGSPNRWGFRHTPQPAHDLLLQQQSQSNPCGHPDRQNVRSYSWTSSPGNGSVVGLRIIGVCIANAPGRPTGGLKNRAPVGRPRTLAMQASITCFSTITHDRVSDWSNHYV